MPITPFHFGPGLLIQETRPRLFSFPIFVLSQVIMDLESFYNILNHKDRIHAYFHTYLGSLLPLLITVLLYVIYKKTVQNTRHIFLCRVIITAWIGVWSHVFLDFIMHADMQPFWPISVDNPTLGLITTENLHLFGMSIHRVRVLLKKKKDY